MVLLVIPILGRYGEFRLGKDTLTLVLLNTRVEAMASKYLQGNATTRCGESHCLRLGAPSCDYCLKPALKRLEAMRTAAEAEAEDNVVPQRSAHGMGSGEGYLKRKS